MNYKKKTSTRGAGKGRKLSSGTRDQLIKDLQRVHKLFPTATPDRDFYRQHGKSPTPHRKSTSRASRISLQQRGGRQRHRCAGT